MDELKMFTRIIEMALNKRKLDNQSETVKDFRDGYDRAIENVREDIKFLIS